MTYSLPLTRSHLYTPSHLPCQLACILFSEESKVKLWHRVSLLSDLKKRGASRVAHFLHSIFKEQAPPQSGEGSLLRWFWSFTGASRAVAARTGATLVVVPQPA